MDTLTKSSIGSAPFGADGCWPAGGLAQAPPADIRAPRIGDSGGHAPNVVGIVYIAAFGRDEGESIGGLLAQGPPTPALAHLDMDEQGLPGCPKMTS